MPKTKLHWKPIPEDYNLLPEEAFLVINEFDEARMAVVELSEIEVYSHDGDEGEFEPVMYAAVTVPAN